jgi:glycosyltransferase involved in cell wall biosynthesis
MSGARVSVVVPTHRRPGHLARTLASILSQSHPPDEVLVVSDGEDPETRRVVAACDRRIVSCTEIAHQGRPAPARNAGLRKAQGDLIAFCDDDDLWEPRKLERQLAILGARPDVALVHTAALQIDEDGRPSGVRRQPPLRYDANPMRGFLGLPFFHVLQSSIVVRRPAIDAAGEYDEDPRLKGREDTELIIRIAARTRRPFARVSTPEVRYRHARTSVGRDPAYQLAERRDYFHAVLLERGTFTPAEHRRFVSNQFAILALNNLRYGWNPSAARWYAAESRRHERTWLNAALRTATAPLALLGPPAPPPAEPAGR